MKPKYIAITSTLLILACGLGTQQPPTREATTTPPTQQPTQVPTQITAIEPIADPNYFRDDFDSELGSGWQWLREDTSNWSLSAVPGALQINADTGSVYEDTITNLLLRPAPPGDFQIETKVTFHPSANFQIAGHIIYESALNFIQAGRAFCDLPSTCAGDGLYIDHCRNGDFVMPNFAVSYTEGDEIYLRLVRQGDTYTLQTSSDGSDCILRGGQASDMNPLQIGLIAGQNSSNAIPALFDYFEVRSLD